MTAKPSCTNWSWLTLTERLAEILSPHCSKRLGAQRRPPPLHIHRVWLVSEREGVRAARSVYPGNRSVFQEANSGE